MQLPRGAQVPLTSGLGGVVFVAVLFELSDPMNELLIFLAWGLVYAIECLLRARGRRLPDPPQPPPATPIKPRGALPYVLAVLAYVGIGLLTHAYLMWTWAILFYVLLLDVVPRTTRALRNRAATPAAPGVEA